MGVVGAQAPEVSPAATEEARQAAYRSLSAETLVDEQLTEIRAAINSGLALGSERFQC